ncbi:hypothetical protein GXP67_29975 [Rhodocytophaga rosea]|uniref:Uncharacterized protein n=1 Tax=Rhodocytophaga rosea TaxID=2704465 RepID=A0A6C0GR89_9BACT|nr:hypothetical protein [Rhodocytophaga rosea]QHT70581.1 hypothetical protein GXP67_29975 [Rhodocytophaga rosea]
MYPRLTILSLFVFFCHFSASAQVHGVSLSKQTFVLPGRKFYISDIIDARIDKNNIGWVRKGLTNTKMEADLKKRFKPELMDFFNRNLPPYTNLQPVIVKVLKFQITEHNGAATESAKAEIVIDFIYKQEDNYYNLFRGIGVTKSGNLDVTLMHADNIRSALVQCLTQFVNEDIEHYLERASVSNWEEISKDFIATLETHQYPILTDSVLKKGIYQRFSDFRNNSPVTAPNLVMEQVSREAKHLQHIYEVKPYLLDEKGNRKSLKNVWGFSDGENLYIYHDKDYFLMDRSGGTYAFYAFGPTQTNYTAITAGAVMGGLVGAVAIGAATQKSTQAEYILDMITGHVTMKDKASIEDTPAITPEYPASINIYWWSGTSKDQALEVYVNDSLVRTIVPKYQLVFDWETQASEIKICVKNQQEACFTFVPSFKKTNYIACSINTKGGINQPEIKSVEAQEGEFYIKKIKSLEEKEKK